MPIEESRFARDELYSADEVFLTGTAAEVTPVREIDHRTVGAGVPGPITTKLRELYHKVVRGEHMQYESWLAPV